MSLPASVMFLNDYQAPYGGSFIPSLLALEKALRARGVACLWVFPAGARERAWCQALMDGERALAFLEGGAPARQRALDGLVRRHGTALIHAHFGFFLAARLEALLRPRLRVALHVHSDFSGGRRPPLWRRMAGALLNALAAKRCLRIMVGKHMAKKERGAVYIPNGVDFSRSSGAAGEREALRARLELGPEERFVLMFGWSPHIKG
ncbi:MAG: hypothetical protein Q4C13_05175, partial [Clostridia bacterium]|nr:hypothetical protein [Clostridia bacterium]